VCSDGLKTRPALDSYPGLMAHDAVTIAATVWRDHARDRDDATAVVLCEAR
jgi:hypothetical protein